MTAQIVAWLVFGAMMLLALRHCCLLVTESWQEVARYQRDEAAHQVARSINQLHVERERTKQLRIQYAALARKSGRAAVE